MKNFLPGITPPSWRGFDSNWQADNEKLQMPEPRDVRLKLVRKLWGRIHALFLRQKANGWG
jgi:hypothetical protein